jgi:hypothetical protein
MPPFRTLESPITSMQLAVPWSVPAVRPESFCSMRRPNSE